MERPERINVRVRKELKNGINELFKEQKFADVFEQLIFDYLEQEIRRKKTFAVATNMALKNCAEEDLEYFTQQDDDIRNEVIHLLEIQKTCFPKGKSENSQISSGAFYPDSEQEPK